MHSPYPVCAPARSAIITGLYRSSIGSGNLWAYHQKFDAEKLHQLKNGKVVNTKPSGKLRPSALPKVVLLQLVIHGLVQSLMSDTIHKTDLLLLKMDV